MIELSNGTTDSFSTLAQSIKKSRSFEKKVHNNVQYLEQGSIQPNSSQRKLNHVFAATTDSSLVTRLRSPGIQSMIRGKQTEAMTGLEKPEVKESRLIC
jgi:hypothetical protein